MDQNSIKTPINKSSINQMENYIPNNSRNYILNVDTSSSAIKTKKIIKSDVLKKKFRKSNKKYLNSDNEKVKNYPS